MGFGREIAKLGKTWDRAHHCAGPGQCIEIEAEGYIYRYQISRRFCVKLISKKPCPDMGFFIKGDF